MSSLERDLKKSVYNKLLWLEHIGDILWFERLNSGKVETRYGSWIQLCRESTPDFVVLLRNKEGNLSFIFLEIKRPDKKGKLSKGQIKFEEKYCKVNDVHYIKAESVEEITDLIYEIGFDKLDSIGIFNF